MDGASFQFILTPKALLNNNVLTFNNYNRNFYFLKPYDENIEFYAQTQSEYLFFPNSRDTVLTLNDNIILWITLDEFKVNIINGIDSVLCQ